MLIYSLFFMTSSDGFGFQLESHDDEMDRDMHELIMHFGTLQDNTLRIEPGQEMTPEKRSALNVFSRKYSGASPNLNQLAQKIREINDGDFFVLLPSEPARTELKLRAELYVQALNNSASLQEARALFEAEWKECQANFGSLLQHYDMHSIRTDRRVWFGETDKETRRCRFCTRTKAEGATFQKKAHAVSEGVGNKTIFLTEECDTCNEHFGMHVEPHFIQWLDVYRVFLGIKGSEGSATIKYKNGWITHESGRMLVHSDNITGDPSEGVQVRLESSKKIAPLGIYKTLCKAALSTLESDVLKDLSKTLRWLRFGGFESEPLPLVASNVIPSLHAPSPKITNYIRMSDDTTLPHVLSEFRLGSYVFLFILPFSARDKQTFSDKEQWEAIWSTFSHYARAPNWRIEDLSSSVASQINETIRMRNANAKGGSSTLSPNSGPPPAP